MNKGVKQQAYRVDENMPFLAFDLLARIIAVRINAAPPFSPAFKLRPSMTAAAGLASRPADFATLRVKRVMDAMQPLREAGRLVES